MFERLLVTTDLSDASENLLTCLGPLRKVGARDATLIHVADVRDVGGLYLSLLRLLKPRLEHLEGTLKRAGYVTRVETPLGKPSREIARIASEGDYSLIVAGTHGESLAKDVLLGSVAHSLVQAAPKPVLLVPINVLAEKEEERCLVLCGDFFRHVIFATDFSHVAERAYGYLRYVVRHTKAEVTLYHAQDPVRIEPHLKDRLEEFNRADFERLSRMEKELSDAGAAAVHKVVAYGRPSQLIVERANSGSHSLLIVGSQGRGYLAEAFLGRVAHHLVHHADIPVLLVPMTA